MWALNNALKIISTVNGGRLTRSARARVKRPREACRDAARLRPKHPARPLISHVVDVDVDSWTTYPSGTMVYSCVDGNNNRSLAEIRRRKRRFCAKNPLQAT